MKQKYTIGFIALVLTIVLAGCVHDYPSMTEDGEEGVDPTLVEVNTEVTLNLELVPLEIITQKMHAAEPRKQPLTIAAASSSKRGGAASQNPGR